MPDLLSLPRELRDDIYELVFRSSLMLKKANRPRIRLSKKNRSNPEEGISPHRNVTDGVSPDALSDVNQLESTDADYFEGEEAIRYPTSEPIPPTNSLLHVNHQIRAEMQETIRKKPVEWRIRLSFRDDKELLYPNWVSMPAFTDRIDALDVEIRIRKKKTASIFSTASSIASTSSVSSTGYIRNRNDGDVFFGGFALLQRLLERGPAFVNKKKHPQSSHVPMTIGCVTVHLLPKDLEYHREPKELLDECVEWVDALLTDKDEDDSVARYSDRKEEWNRINDFLHLFAERIERFVFDIQGMRREWVLKDAMVERDERARTRAQRELEEPVETSAQEDEDIMEC